MTEVRTSIANGVGHIVFDGPAILNALSPSTLRSLLDACDAFAQASNVRLVRIEGAGGHFSAGAHLPAFHRAMSQEDPIAIADLGRRAAQAVAELPQITVAAIQGHCVGGGIVLAAACDLRLASDNARFVVPELEAGLPLGWGGLERLCALVKETVAVDWILTCRAFKAEEALNTGLLHRVFATSTFAAEADEFIDGLARRASIGLRITKRQLAQYRRGCFDARTDAEALVVASADEEAKAIGQRYLKEKLSSR